MLKQYDLTIHRRKTADLFQRRRLTTCHGDRRIGLVRCGTATVGVVRSRGGDGRNAEGAKLREMPTFGDHPRSQGSTAVAGVVPCWKLRAS